MKLIIQTETVTFILQGKFTINSGQSKKTPTGRYAPDQLLISKPKVYGLIASREMVNNIKDAAITSIRLISNLIVDLSPIDDGFIGFTTYTDPDGNTSICFTGDVMHVKMG